MAKEKKEELTEKQKKFCEFYIFDWNGTKAAIKAGYSEHTAKEIASENLTKPNIKAYIDQIQGDIEKQAGISRLMVIQETSKIAFSSIASLHNAWITLKEFEALTDEQKACISQIETQKRFEKDGKGENAVVYEIDFVKIKLHDKMKALETLSRILGYNAVEKHEVATTGEIVLTRKVV